MAYRVPALLRVRPELSRRVAVLLNARARQVTRRVIAAARAVVPAGDLFVSEDLEAAREIVREVITGGFDAVLAGGGDGTFTRCVSDLAQAASQLGRRMPAVGVLRLGTGNAVAETLGVAEGRSLEDILEGARTRPTRPLDLLSVGDRLAPFAGVGLDAQILDDYAAVGKVLDASGVGQWSGAAARYALAVGLRSVPRFLLTARPVVTAVNAGSPALRIGEDGQPTGEAIPAGEVLYRGPASLASASTVPFYGLGMKMFPFADAMPRRFQLRLADCSTVEVLAPLPALFRGTYRSETVRDFLCDRVALYCEDETAVQVGGDVVGRQRQLMLQLAPRPIAVLN